MIRADRRGSYKDYVVGGWIHGTSFQFSKILLFIIFMIMCKKMYQIQYTGIEYLVMSA
jgi:hypothetical protein